MANTGFKAWTTLEEYFVDNGVATGRTKLNANGDPNYVAQVYNDTFCPVADVTRPSTPTSVTSSNITDTTLTLNWTASTDNVQVTSYEVYQNGVQLAILGNVLTYNVTGLTFNTNYNFVIYAKDAAGNYSIATTGHSVTTANTTDVTPPSAPTITSIARNGNALEIVWTGSTDNIAVTGYELSKQEDDALYYVVGPIALPSPYTDANVIAGSGIRYSYRIRAYDAGGNFSTYSNIGVKIMI